MADNERITGGCFCGRVRYDVEPDYITYRYCFCSRCRKMRGTSNASNVFAKPGTLRYLSGEDLIRRFDHEGSRFGNCFCTDCGAPVPRPLSEGRGWLIPAGSFDSDPGVRPESAIFWDDHAEWMPNVDTLEKKSAY
jgi:hypothetical protein